MSLISELRIVAFDSPLNREGASRAGQVPGLDASCCLAYGAQEARPLTRVSEGCSETQNPGLLPPCAAPFLLRDVTRATELRGSKREKLHGVAVSGIQVENV